MLLFYLILKNILLSWNIGWQLSCFIPSKISQYLLISNFVFWRVCCPSKSGASKPATFGSLPVWGSEVLLECRPSWIIYVFSIADFTTMVELNICKRPHWSLNIIIYSLTHSSKIRWFLIYSTCWRNQSFKMLPL